MCMFLRLKLKLAIKKATFDQNKTLSSQFSYSDILNMQIFYCELIDLSEILRS